MAKKTPKPGRTVLVLAIVVAAMYALVTFSAPAVQGESRWKPALGLDLEGGTRITLTASGKQPSATQLKLAAGIIDKRANGSGVAEASTKTQGGRNIVVEIPGKNRRSLVDSVKRTAQLRFRLVAATAAGVPTPPTASPSATGSPTAGATGSPSAAPSGSPSVAATPSASVGASPSASNNPRPGADYADPTPAPTPTATKTKKPQKAKASTTASPSAAATDPASPAASDPASPAPAPAAASINDPLAWQTNPDAASIAAFTSYVCPKGGTPPAVDDPKKPLVTCDEDGNKYLLSISMIQGTQLKTASYGTPQGGVGWAVDLAFKSSARKTFATVTQTLSGTGRTFAIVLDGKVLSAPQVTSPILDGNAQITGTFTQAEASSLSNSLKFGALPIKFDQPTVETVGPSLAGDQLKAGVLAGIVGLLIVMIYCLFYYRGLGVLVIASLLVAAGTTYVIVLLLAKTAGFTLTLPGIAGLIVAVGITADSFIVYFERIRDEMRTGKSMRVAVELGWARARNTCLAADAVSFLAALVLYIFTIGVVKGFAFALGISTLIDLAVFFWFTKPSMTLLARRHFFSSGSRFSGLSPETLGIDQGHHSLGAGVSAGTVGRNA